MSELIAEDTAVHGDFTVEYRFEPALGFLVPAEMRESVWVPPRGRASAEVSGKATYSRFRRFQVSVDEAIAPPNRVIRPTPVQRSPNLASRPAPAVREV